jgi:chromate transporter
LSSALSAITAAVVGVILNLAIWFLLHTLFAEVNVHRGYGMQWEAPAWASIDWWAGAIALLACLLTFYWKTGMAITLAVSAAAGAAVFLVQHLVT